MVLNHILVEKTHIHIPLRKGRITIKSMTFIIYEIARIQVHGDPAFTKCESITVSR